MEPVGQSFNSVSVDGQGQRIHAALTNWSRLRSDADRLVSAFFYLREARWLRRRPIERYGVLAGVVLNYVKAIQMVFGSTRDEVRTHARSLGIDKTMVDERLIPLMLIRDNIDVAHPKSPLSHEDHRTIGHFLQNAGCAVEKVFQKLQRDYFEGKLKLPRWSKLSKDDRNLMARLRQYNGE
jgi:hypothetical protein